MKQWIKYVPLIFISGLVGLLFVKMGKPKLYAAETKYNFGVLDQGGELQHRFTLQNSGWKPLEITAINVSCGCIKLARADANVLAPGQKTPLNIIWDVPKYSTQVSEVVRVETNDPEQPVQQFSIMATVQARTTLEPSVINFGVLDKSDLPSSETLTLKEESSASDEATVQVNTKNLFLKAEVKRGTDKVWKIELKLDRDAPLGPIDGEIDVKPSWGNSQNVPLLGEVVGDVVAEPSEVLIDKSQNSTGKAIIRVTLSETASKGASVEKVRNITVSPSLARYVTVEANGSQLNVNYKFPGVEDKKTMKGRISFDVELGDGTKTQMVVPVVSRFEK